MPFLIKLYFEYQTGPKEGLMESFMCLGIENFLYQMGEIARVPSVFVVGFEVLG